MERPHHFLALDALRGLGAFVVMQAHAARFFGHYVPASSPLAVDFFAMLSGFVLSLVYQARLDQWSPGQGWSTRTFMRVRLIRIYPVYLLGVLASFSFLFLQSQYGRDQIPVPTLLSFLALGLFLLPVPPGISGLSGGNNAMFPCDVPAWSLFFEILANLVHGVLLRRRGWRFIAATTVAWGLIFQTGILTRHTINIGAYRTDLLFGFARILYCYSLGLLLFRVWGAVSHRIPRISPVVPIVLFIGLLSIPGLSTSQASHFAILAITLGLSVVILLAANAPMPKRFVRLAETLGTSSYAVYLLHVPIAQLFEQIWKRLFHRPIEAAAPWSGILCLLLTLVLAVLAHRFYDEPVRAAIRRRLFRLNPSPPPTPSYTPPAQPSEAPTLPPRKRYA